MPHLAAVPNEGALLLLVEDELNTRKFLRVTLKHSGYRLLEAATGSAGLELARTEKPALVLLDLGLPDMDGCEVSRRIRKFSGAPIIVLSARNAEEQKIAALDDGADDYVTKPFSPNELLARIRVALRRSPNPDDEDQAPTGIFEIGELQVDFDQRRVLSSGREVRLTPTEYKLLSVLIDSAGRVVTHRHLLQRVWGISGADHVNYLRVYMRQLRNKLEPAPATPRYLLTEPAVGYRLRLRD